MKKIYLVIGHTGEYDSRTDWNVTAFDSKELAEKRAINAENRAKEIIEEHKEGDFLHFDDVPKNINEYDRNMYIDSVYPWVYYVVSEVDYIGAG